MKFSSFFFQKIWLDCSINEKSPLLDTLVVADNDNSYHGQLGSKVNHFGEKVKYHEKLSKIMTFQKNLSFVASNFSPILEVHIWTCPKSFSSYKLKKKSRKFDFLAFFQKKSTRDVFYQGYSWFPNFFYAKMKHFKLWFLAQKVFKRA